ncbi:helix-turn-helix domain-containing protein [Intestinimonas massiliensis (ex Afouda et al. 2020)]|uniref:helix-turn-helix domain-containing protein n=1 Tax=Intestinimonas massiliensis (ex Afouda et al. 2020) TaxID=1673721 RepID=UPI0010302134|nr:helix-turn-helix domain-containing protein [Intestinimonas massiliensis (ex Afouda et al. 2020)]
MFRDYPDVMTVRQAAHALGICEASVYRLIHARALGTCRVGRKILVPKVCLIDYVTSARYMVSHL